MKKMKLMSVNPYAYATTKQDIDCKNKNSFTGKQDPKCKALYLEQLKKIKFGIYVPELQI